MVFRASLFSAFGAAKRWFGTNADGSERKLTTADFYKVLQFLLYSYTLHTQHYTGWCNYWLHCVVFRGAH